MPQLVTNTIYDSSIVNINLPANLTSIGESAFRYTYNLQKITLPTNLVTIGNYAFYQSGLEEIKLPSKLQGIGRYAFAGCTNLKKVDLGSVVSVSEYAFAGCSKVTDLTLSPNITTIGNYAFAGVPNGDENGMESWYWIDCSKGIAVDNLTIPSTVQSVGTGAFARTSLKSVEIHSQYVSAEAFQYCSNLTDVKFGSELKTLGSNVFYGCTNLKKFDVDAACTNYASVNGVLMDEGQKNLMLFPAGKTGVYTVPSTVTTISDNAFSGCSGLTNIDLSNNTVKTIGNNAFSGCTGVDELTIYDQVTSIGSGAFMGVPIVNFESNTPATLAGADIVNTLSFIVVPSTALTTYRTANVWSNLADIIVPDTDYSKDLTLSIRNDDRSDIEAQVS